MSDTDLTNPGSGASAPADEGVIDLALTTDQADGDAGDNPDIQDNVPDDDEEEIEVAGKKYRIPKSVNAERLMQADYTRKTQEIAELRRQTEAKETAFKAEAEAHQVFLKENARLISLDEQIAAYDDVDWQAAAASDAANGTNAVVLHQIELQRLKDARSKVGSEIERKTAERNFAAQQSTAKQREECQAVVAREIPNWTERRTAVEAFAAANGVSQAEFQATTDPRVFKMLHYAQMGMQQEKQQRAQAALKRSQQVTPAPTLGGQPAPTNTKDPDKMTTAEWMEWDRKRTAEKNKARRR